MTEDQQTQWVANGWGIAVRLLAALKPDNLPLVSKTPAMVFDDKFVLFYARDPLANNEWWIITGEFFSCHCRRSRNQG